MPQHDLLIPACNETALLNAAQIGRELGFVQFPYHHEVAMLEVCRGLHRVWTAESMLRRQRRSEAANRIIGEAFRPTEAWEQFLRAIGKKGKKEI